MSNESTKTDVRYVEGRAALAHQVECSGKDYVGRTRRKFLVSAAVAFLASNKTFDGPRKACDGAAALLAEMQGRGWLP